VFYPESYGAEGNLKIVTDGAIINGQNTLTCSTSTPFTSADVNKLIHVGGAGGSAYTPLCTTISAFTSSSQVTLAAPATSTVSGSIVAYATNDVTAVNEAVAAAVAYAESSSTGYAQVFLAKMYAVGGSPTVGGSTYGNAYVPLPVISGTARKVSLEFRGLGDASELDYWNQLTPDVASSGLICLANSGSVSGTYGPTHIIGGPYDGYGGTSVNFSNMLAVLNGITLIAPFNGTCGGADFFGVGEANVGMGAGVSAQALAVPPSSGAVPTMGTNAALEAITNFGYYGIRMPSYNNNANCNIGTFSAEGFCEGLGISEHTTWHRVEINYCYNGTIAYLTAAGGGGPSNYPATGLYIVIGECYNGILFLDELPVIIPFLGVEGLISDLISDSSDYGKGSIAYSVANGSSTVNGATGITKTNLNF
jgi:hypothetical protein